MAPTKAAQARKKALSQPAVKAPTRQEQRRAKKLAKKDSKRQYFAKRSSKPQVLAQAGLGVPKEQNLELARRRAAVARQARLVAEGSSSAAGAGGAAGAASQQPLSMAGMLSKPQKRAGSHDHLLASAEGAAPRRRGGSGRSLDEIAADAAARDPSFAAHLAHDDGERCYFVAAPAAPAPAPAAAAADNRRVGTKARSRGWSGCCRGGSAAARR